MLNFYIKYSGNDKVIYKTTSVFEVIAFDSFQRSSFTLDECKEALHIFNVLTTNVPIDRFDVIGYIVAKYHVIKTYKEQKLIDTFQAWYTEYLGELEDLSS